MIDPERIEEPRPQLDNGQSGNSAGLLPPEAAPDAPVTGEPGPAKELTADEQMALYEKDLKENDWGHQPC